MLRRTVSRGRRSTVVLGEKRATGYLKRASTIQTQKCAASSQITTREMVFHSTVLLVALLSLTTIADAFLMHQNILNHKDNHDMSDNGRRNSRSPRRDFVNPPPRLSLRLNASSKKSRGCNNGAINQSNTD